MNRSASPHSPEPEAIDADLERRRRLGWSLFALGVPGLTLLIEAVARLSFSAFDVIVIDEPALDAIAIGLGLRALASLPALVGLRVLQRATPLEGGRFGSDLSKAAPWLTLVVAGGLVLPFVAPLYPSDGGAASGARAAEAYLRVFSDAQERYFDEHFRYSPTLEALEIPHPPEGLRLDWTIAHHSWSARLIDGAGAGCSARYRNAPALATPGGMTPGENEVVCDAF